jgi:hypothetical protein
MAASSHLRALSGEARGALSDVNPERPAQPDQTSAEYADDMTVEFIDGALHC